MATWTDKALRRAIERSRRRRERADRPGRAARLDSRIGRLEGWLALPEAERPERRRLPVKVESLQAVLATVAKLSAGTPIGMAISGLSLAIGTVDRVAVALRGKDREALVAAVASEVEARAGGDDEAVDRVIDELEDALL